MLKVLKHPGANDVPLPACLRTRGHRQVAMGAGKIATEALQLSRLDFRSRQQPIELVLATELAHADGVLDDRSVACDSRLALPCGNLAHVQVQLGGESTVETHLFGAAETPALRRAQIHESIMHRALDLVSKGPVNSTQEIWVSISSMVSTACGYACGVSSAPKCAGSPRVMGFCLPSGENRINDRSFRAERHSVQVRTRLRQLRIGEAGTRAACAAPCSPPHKAHLYHRREVTWDTRFSRR